MGFSSSTGGAESAGGSAHTAGRAAARGRSETRRRLVAAATEQFAQHGLLKTTTTQIARGAGVAAGTFYLHFRDKHELFREIAFDALGQLRKRMADANLRADSEPQVALRARMVELVAFAEEKRDLVRIVFGRGHEAGAVGDEILDALFPDVEAGLRESRAAGRIDPALHPAVAAQSLLAIWVRVIAWWGEDPSRAPRDEVIETLVRLSPLSHPPQRGD